MCIESKVYLAIDRIPYVESGRNKYLALGGVRISSKSAFYQFSEAIIQTHTDLKDFISQEEHKN